MKTLFPINNYQGPDYFCDREYEIQRLIENIESNQSTMITSIRRMGKTGLIKHLYHQLGKEYKGIYLDILPTEDLTSFLNILATSMVRTISEKTSFGKKVWHFIKSIRPNISFDQLSGEMKISFDLGDTEHVKTEISTLFSMLEEQPFKTVIAVDEFQQVLNYPEKNCDAWFRTIIQKLSNVVFIFSGSEQHIMNDLFTNPSKPFFRSTSVLELGPIPKEKYRNFIIDKFNSVKRSMSEEIADEILDWNMVHTFYVQLMCERIYKSGAKKINTELFKATAYRIIKEQEAVFYNFRELLTTHQWNLLKAIANETHAYSITAASFLKKYQLGSSSVVLRSLNSLIEKEMVCTQFDEEGKKYYRLYDVLLMRWVQHL